MTALSVPASNAAVERVFIHGDHYAAKSIMHYSQTTASPYICET